MQNPNSNNNPLNDRAPLDGNFETRPSQNGKISILLKGSITNKNTLIKLLTNYGYDFKNKSQETVIANLLEWYVIYGNFDVKNAIKRVFNLIEGNVALMVFDESTPEKHFAVKRDVELYIGQYENNVYVSDNKAKLYLHTNSHIDFEDNVIATIFDNGRITLLNI